MAKIRYTIRLYRLHDLDLITFIETHEFNILHAIYSSVTAFAKGEAFVIEIPPRRIVDLPKLNRVYIKALTLDEDKDKQAIDIINKIAPGYRNSFLKNLLRMYLCHPLSEEYFRVVKKAKDTDEIIFETPQSEVDEKNELFTKMLGIFKEDRKMVKAGKIPRGRPFKNPEDAPKNEVEVIREKRVKENKEKEEEKETNIVDDTPSNDISKDVIDEPEMTKDEEDEIMGMFNNLI